MLRENEPELKAAGVVSVSLFGSTARGEFDPGDVDIAVRLGADFLMATKLRFSYPASRDVIYGPWGNRLLALNPTE